MLVPRPPENEQEKHHRRNNNNNNNNNNDKQHIPNTSIFGKLLCFNGSWAPQPCRDEDGATLLPAAPGGWLRETLLPFVAYLLLGLGALDIRSFTGSHRAASKEFGVDIRQV